LFGRDSIISAWQMLGIDPSVAKATLAVLAKYQGKEVDPFSEEEPGKTLHEHRFTPEEREELPEWKFPYYGSIDSTPLFVILATEYFKKTGDSTFILEIADNLLAAFEWMKKYGDRDGDGYLEYQRRNPLGLFHQGWKDGVQDHLKIKPPVRIVEVQGYVYAAYSGISFLAKKVGWKQISEEALKRARLLRETFNPDFWMKKEGFFALALDGRGRQRRAVTSNPGHLLFTEIASSSKISSLVSRFFMPDLWTTYGIRTHSSQESDFDTYSHHLGCIWPHDNWFIYKGLESLGFRDHAREIKTALIRAYRELDKIPEFYTVAKGEIVDLSTSSIREAVSNPLQAWASAGLLAMIWND
ncbi:MAG: amylo-alpha-1,6-glucosidase, partial [Candidatus Korarchaeota archaeon]|nr:amylo-alpha-1,6-glucosidase [Candidatus Korarchaeota archaeon]NIU84682.1 amylo-alpha-1,6-glucosidase [Candidatus Thorarchaeota archaeon]NIW14701.1 amylo-alpha-1,6-glucosidase [Candidatus Thorarchaeota archaeon]